MPPAIELPLPERMDHPHCLTLRAQIEEARGAPLDLLAGDVGFFGAAAAELLLAARAEWHGAGLDFAVTSPSDAMQSQLGDLGLSVADLNVRDIS